MAPLFPALFLGGPPHSGKSTLLYRLSHALRERGVEHYALRASPDGEGDWSQETAPDQVRVLRMRAKTDWTPQFAERMSRDIDRRHLPLLVDVGGKVSPETERIAAVCTHGILLSNNTAAFSEWTALLHQQGRMVIAEIVSQLDGPQIVTQTTPILRGTLSGLQVGQSSDGVCFDALLTLVQRYMSYPPDTLYQTHRNAVDVDLVLHLERPIYPLTARPEHGPAYRWYPTDLRPLLTSLPANEPLALYGRAPLWVYAALAAFTEPVPWVFQAHTGWVVPPRLLPTTTPDPQRLRWDTVASHGDAFQISLSLPGGYLDYDDAQEVPVPLAPAGYGILLDGKLPTWLYAALARTYRTAAWLAVLQPQLGYVVVWSQHPHVQVGDVRPAPPAEPPE
ncbi:MAG: hypothetical protein HC876_10655 [Chloroflexaceae bacterium]|nr:hypothetical protein [Chloroflexaceae bacterium]